MRKVERLAKEEGRRRIRGAPAEVPDSERMAILLGQWEVECRENDVLREVLSAIVKCAENDDPDSGWWRTCYRCGGIGKILVRNNPDNLHPLLAVQCPECDGVGRTFYENHQRCFHCGQYTDECRCEGV